ncbi:MAG TPA: choice-of-anchor N protein, partial [Candidatus Hypogeohydataceae bacterium YC40]
MINLKGLTKGLIPLLFLALSLFLPQASVSAIPMFQTYIEGATAGTIGQDEDTWFHSGTPFTLDVVGAFGPKTTSLTGVTLAISIPEGQTGTISLTPLGGAAVPILLTTLGQSIPGVNPAANADEHILTNVVGNNGYDTKSF